MDGKHEPSRREFITRSGGLLLTGRLSQLEGFGTGPSEGFAVGASAARVVAERGKSPVIDCHAHVGIGHELVNSWDTVADAEEILRHAEEAGVDKTVVFPINAATYKEANEYIARTCLRYPGKFIGFARHSAKTESGQIRSLLVHEVYDLGLRGLKLHDQPSQEILDTVKELSIPVMAHLERVQDFEDFLPYYPKVNFIVAHLGAEMSYLIQEHLDAIDLAKRYPNVYLDSSIVLLTRYLEMAIEQLGPEKILLGSDGPDGDVRMDIFKIRVLKLPTADEEMILGQNMQRLLGGKI